MADIDKLFESISSEILSEDVKLQMAVLFEGSLTEAINAKEIELQEANTTEIAAWKETIVEKLDSFLTCFCEEFTKDNAVAITESVKVKTAERVLKTFSNMINDFNFELTEKKITNEASLTEAKKEINNLTTKLIEEKQKSKLIEKAAILSESCFGLKTELQKAQICEYAKALPFDELFEKKLQAKIALITEEVKTDVTEKIVIRESIDIVPEHKEEKSEMSKYVQRLA